jgi:hypothetical protein
MAFLRKIKAGLVKTDIETFVGEEGNLFFNIETGELRLSNGSTPGGTSVTGGGSGSSPLTVSETGETGISNQVRNVTALRFDRDTGFNVEDLGQGEVKVSLGSTFKTWKVEGQEDLVAVGEDTIKLVAENGIILTTNPNGEIKTLTISLDSSQVSAGSISETPVAVNTETLENGDSLIYQNGEWVNSPSMYWASRNW